MENQDDPRKVFLGTNVAYKTSMNITIFYHAFSEMTF